VFIAPGSTVVRRMIKKYRFEAIIGVGCLMEVREGLEMCDQYGIPAQGVLQLRDGCVETAVNWEDVVEVAKLGIVGGSKGSTSTIDEIIIDTA
jgi:hypothetical protein